MNTLKQKIKSTLLFTPVGKIELLTRLDELTIEVQTQLESIIDEYNAKYVEATTVSRQNIVKDLTAMEQKNKDNPAVVSALKSIKLGLEEMFPSK